MQYNVILEANIAREKRRDLLRRVEQDRLLRLARAGCESGAKAGRPVRAGSKIRMMWRRAVA